MTTRDEHDGLSDADIARFGADPAATFRDNLERVRARMALACEQSGRDSRSVHLLAITKTVPAHILRFAFEAGIGDFGENKIQEALGKQAALGDLPVRWHIVGHLQSNKAKFIPRLASAFHALDSLPLARLISKRLDMEDRELDVYVQVNTSGEASKFGLSPETVLSFVDAMQAFPRLKVRGLMTLALFSRDTERVRACFRLLRTLSEDVSVRHPTATGLSMGMSGDYDVAIAEGATVVRVGQAIFGVRPTPDDLYWPGFASGSGD